MITYVVSDIFKSPARVLVNTVNTVGVMGKGVAKDFKLIYPDMFKQYQKLCEENKLDIGKLWIYKTSNKWILNFPTKKHWRNRSKLEYIEAGLKKFVCSYADKGITSISFPMLGCGNGELDWDTEVRPLMEKYLNPLPIDVFIHLYRDNPFEVEHRNIKEIKQWLRSEPGSLAFVEIWDDLANLLKEKVVLETLDTGQQFSVELSISKEEITVEFNGNKYYFSKDDLLVLWQQVRDVGFCVPEIMPGELGKYASCFIALLNQLPYFQPVLIANQYDKLNKDSVGLRLWSKESNKKGKKNNCSAGEKQYELAL